MLTRSWTSNTLGSKPEGDLLFGIMSVPRIAKSVLLCIDFDEKHEEYPALQLSATYDVANLAFSAAHEKMKPPR